MSRRFEDLVEEYHALVMALISRYYSGRLRDRADDISQEVWTKLWVNFKKNENNIVDFKSYLVRTVQTTLWDAIRQLDTVDVEDELIEQMAEPESVLPGTHERMALTDLIGRLGDEEARMVRAYLQGFDNREIAVLLGTSEGRVRNLLTRIKKKMATWGGR